MSKLNQVQKDALMRLKKEGRGLTKQEYKTLKGQILSGSQEGALRGLERVLNKRRCCQCSTSPNHTKPLLKSS